MKKWVSTTVLPRVRNLVALGNLISWWGAKGSHVEVAAQVAFKLGVDDVARLLAVVELARVLANRGALPLLRRCQVSRFNGNPVG